jgi:hypothetical protein
VLTISIYRGDQRSKRYAAFDGDLPQQSQNWFSRLTLVLWPLIVIERFVVRFGESVIASIPAASSLTPMRCPREFTAEHLDRNRPFRDGHHSRRSQTTFTKKTTTTRQLTKQCSHDDDE